jgi:exopolyphosphatase / guanosine-5'-triphosphate,3'-diphosphate pyrophosphatase
MFNLWRSSSANTLIEANPKDVVRTEPMDDTVELTNLADTQETKLVAIRSFIKKLKQNEHHAEEVRQLSVQLFDTFTEYHHCGERERFLLECGALLHDIGHAISRKQHHKHSLRLIQEANFASFSASEIAIIANIARYHRKSLPKPTHLPFAQLPSMDRHIVRKMASFLRIADSLIRSEGNRVEHVDIVIPNEHCEFIIHSKEACVQEIEAFQRRKDLFVQTYGRDAMIVKKQEV